MEHQNAVLRRGKPGQRTSIADEGGLSSEAAQLIRYIVDTYSLSPQEGNVLVLAFFEGLEDKEIGARLGISPKTVHEYWTRILTKTTLSSQKRVLAMLVHRLLEELE
jgi:DNA-binding NarL/FixJ family response regulator